jgi:Protein of unknown function (DUF2652)/Polyketide cyclase / dehydrase and lipid transport
MPDNKTKEVSFLFIPDISGFTEFVNQTEIEHSQHIISELLEIIINSDELGLSVSEIEGDAVLFYKNNTPKAGKIVEQAKHTFINFHNYLRKYDKHRVCRCGACETAVNLTLKFIAHAGDIKMIDIKDHQKLHGSDVILAHRLLKNPIGTNEYILFTKPFQKDLNEGFATNEPNSFLPVKGRVIYEKFGSIEYSFIPLKHLHQFVTEPEQIVFPGLSKNKVRIEHMANCNAGEVYDNFTNLDKRKAWNEEIREIILMNSKWNEEGTMHQCVIGQNNLFFETLGRLEQDDQIIYAERIKKRNGVKNILAIYTFIHKGARTKILLDVDFEFSNTLFKWLKPVIQYRIKKNFKKQLTLLSRYCEH